MNKLELVSLSPTADSRLRWADGTLKGIKTLKWSGGGVWSPLHRVEWVGARLVAEAYNPDEGVRNKGGIHAIWPPQLHGTLDELEASTSLREFEGYARRRHDEFTALVSGWGRSIMGDVGWRAEHCRIRCVISPPTRSAVKFRQWCRNNDVKWSVL